MANTEWGCHVCAILVVGGTGFLHGQTPPSADQPISTDRPAVANSSVVVPQGSFQAENGLAVTTASAKNSFDFPETSLRFGVAEKTELRLSAPDYFGNTPSGFGDMTIGVKQQLGPVKQFDVSVILFLSLPTGAAALSSHGYDPGLQVPWSRSLSTNWSIAGQLAVYGPTQGSTRNVTGESTLLFDRQLTKRWDGFVEYAGDFPESGGPRHLLHFGSAYRPAPSQQVDIHVGVGLSSAAVGHFIGVGYSFRFQLIPR